LNGPEVNTMHMVGLALSITPLSTIERASLRMKVYYIFVQSMHPLEWPELSLCSFYAQSGRR